jgi:hypothetical protein
MKPHTLTALDSAATTLRDIPFSNISLVLGSTTTVTA